MLKKIKRSKLPKISIVIPSFNKADYIGETLESIILQSYSNLEVIVQDGGSTDKTVEIIKKYAKKHPEIIRWESKKDKGQLDAINKGLKKAKGDLLTYINADDFYLDKSFNKIAKIYGSNPEHYWFAGKGYIVDQKGKKIKHTVTEYKNLLLKINRYKLLLMANYLMQPSVFFTKEAYKALGPLIGVRGIVIEYDFWLSMGKEHMPVIVDDYISSFRLTQDSLSVNRYRDILMRDFQIAKKHTKSKLLLFLHKLHNQERIRMVSNWKL